MPDIQEAKCFEFTVQILPPPPLDLFLCTPFFQGQPILQQPQIHVHKKA